jgi:hypothetical protein
MDTKLVVAAMLVVLALGLLWYRGGDGAAKPTSLADLAVQDMYGTTRK